MKASEIMTTSQNFGFQIKADPQEYFLLIASLSL
jgi:hypothetical protein